MATGPTDQFSKRGRDKKNPTIAAMIKGFEELSLNITVHDPSMEQIDTVLLASKLRNGWT